MDTTDPEIRFDAQGRCNHCTAALERMRRQLLPKMDRQVAIQSLVAAMKREGAGREYDCVVGVSGGVDSTMTAYLVKRFGLRGLAVHFDNGWNSELAVDNIQKTCEALGMELYTHVVDWEEFRDLQLCFLRASLANCEAPTDHGINALLPRVARRVGTRFIVSGSNVATEAIMPVAWGHYNGDLRLLKALHRQYGRRPLSTMPTISIGQYLYYFLACRIRQVPLLNLVEYDRTEAKALLLREIGWRDYGGKHYESVWTRFFQGHYLPTKFGFDKRKAHLSTLICAGQMDRETALRELEKPIYDDTLLRGDREFVLKKLGLGEEEFAAIIAQAPRQASEFPNNGFFFHTLMPLKDLFRKIATAS